MRSFLIKSGIFLFSLLAVTVLLYFITKPVYQEPENDFMASMIDKHNRADSLGAPRVLIAGGSNNAFSMNSEIIQDSLQIPVVNLGLNVGLGINFILNELSDVAEEGDIIFIFMTYFESVDGIYALKKHTVEHYPKAGQYFRLNLQHELNQYASELRSRIRSIIVSLILHRSLPDQSPADPATESAYTRDGFNSFGDFNGHHKLAHDGALDQRFKFEYRYWEGIPLLNRFFRRMEKENIHVYYFFPAYPESEYYKNRTVIDAFESDIRSDLKMPVLGSPDQNLFPDSLFFDTVYHLDQHGAKLHAIDVVTLISQDAELMEIVKQTRLRRREID